ncbi:polysaccharide biosynthesis protein [Candidatus Bipolaricaulota bacterium]|nr:polysaccharide biosynthesis protein [Candidatus Bipolaricaulota bacterium]
MTRRAQWILVDAIAIGLAMFLAFLLRFDGAIPAPSVGLLYWALGLAMVIKVTVFFPFRLYQFSWRHVGIRELVNVAVACLVGSAILAAAILLLRGVLGFERFPRSVLIIDAAICFILIGSLRLSGRLARIGSGRKGQRAGQLVLIIGAGEAGAQLVRAIQEEDPPMYLPVGFVDDDPRKAGQLVYGVRVLGARADLPRLIVKHDVVAVLVAIPSASAETIRETVDLARRGGIQDIKILPVLSELYTGRVDAQALRALRPEDLLKRDPVRIEPHAIEALLTGKTVLVTGAAGSIGSEICRQVLRFGAKHLVALDFNETGLFDLEADLVQLFPDRRIEVAIADVRDRARVNAVFEAGSPSVVYHAAAYKHVPLMEAFPAEAVKTNVMGTRNVLEEACRSKVAAFVLISTDKAVNPTSVMGASKRVAEMLVRARSGEATKCVAVRFGNVLGSRGSVLMTFRDQIERRQAITITPPDMLRYFMIISEAAQLVLQASAAGRAGDVLVLDMGEPVSIVELAKDLIRSHGLEPDRDVPIVYTGVRPGEKLIEELLTAEEGTDATSHERLFVARMADPAGDWTAGLEQLVAAALAGKDENVLSLLRTLVPRYRSPE